MCGTLDFLAPEIVRRQPYGPAVDLWALGAIAYEWLYGEPPFFADSNEATEELILAASLRFPTGAGVPAVPWAAQDLIRRLLRLRPEARLSLDDVLCHPWLVANGVAEGAGGGAGEARRGINHA